MIDEELFKAWKSEQYKDQSTEERLEFVEHLHTFPKYFEKTFIDGYHEGFKDCAKSRLNVTTISDCPIKDEEIKDEEMAEEYFDKECPHSYADNREQLKEDVVQAFLAGLKAGRPQWHKITDWKDNSQFPNDEIKTYLVRLYQDHYVICEVDITEGYRQFYLPDNLDDIDPQEVLAWCEIPTFDKE